MPPFVSIIILTLAVSLDGFGVGVMYGLRKIRIPWLSIAIISCCSGAVIFLSMQIGVYLLQYIPPLAAKTVGAVILICIGVWAIIQMMLQGEREASPVIVKDQNKIKIVHLEIRRIGLVIDILKTPSKADVDRSGNISASEAALLGAALSLDCFGAGIGAALIGFSPVITSAMIALSSGLFISAGLRIGYLFSGVSWIRKLSILPGCILIMMGISKLL